MLEINPTAMRATANAAVSPANESTVQSTGAGSFENTLKASNSKPTPLTMDLSGDLRAIEQAIQSLFARSSQLNDRVAKGELSLHDAEYINASRDIFLQTFQLQNAAQRVSMGAELMSKVVEHSTSSTRTVLQTQA